MALSAFRVKRKSESAWLIEIVIVSLKGPD